MDKKNYVVAKGVSFIGGKKHFKEGDPIDETVFGKKETFDKLVSAGDIILAPVAPAEPKEKEPEQPPKKSEEKESEPPKK